MHRAHGVQVLWAGRALENGLAIVHLHDQEVQRLGNGRVGQFAPQHGLHLLQAIEVGDLLAGGYTRARACVQRREAQRHWKAAQLALNEALGVERVMALHALVDDSLDLLAALPAQEAGHDE